MVMAAEAVCVLQFAPARRVVVIQMQVCSEYSAAFVTDNWLTDLFSVI